MNDTTATKALRASQVRAGMKLNGRRITAITPTVHLPRTKGAAPVTSLRFDLEPVEDPDAPVSASYGSTELVKVDR